MMKVWTTLGQKGGSGKTTVAINLAVAAELSGQTTLVIDTDPQRSAADWAASRDSDRPAVLASDAGQLPELLRRAERAGADLVIVDAAPHAEKAAADCANVADLVVSPARTSILDLRTARASRDIAAATQTPLVAVLVGVPPRGPEADQARDALEGLGIEVSPVRWGYRTVYRRSLAMSQGALEMPRSVAAAAHDEVNALFGWLEKLGGQSVTR